MTKTPFTTLADTRTKTQAEHYRDYQETLLELQRALKETWALESLPDGWDALESKNPTTHNKTKITIRLDSEMLRWFRKLGPGYQARINQVLFIYWKSYLSGTVRTHWDWDEVGPTYADALPVLLPEDF